ncbi:Uncharacterised protein [uncultured archaeon]|nr:Uncharacterised protein [uncultured archaeon]
MKGLNTARILGLAGLTMTLAASVVAAGTVYSSQLKDDPIITANGQPAAKIVVGANSQIADGIAASNIAAALAQYTYESKAVSTVVTGLDGVSCTLGGATGSSGAGTCEVSNKKVTIDITVPGQLANAHQFKTLITDSVDKQLGNRMSTLSEDNYTADMTTSDTSQILSPLRGALGDNARSRNLYRIGENEFSPFSTAMNTPVRDQQATSDFTYTAQQGFWTGTGSPSYDGGSGVYFDSNSQYRQVLARPQAIAYNVRFLGNDYGIPVCTATNSSGLWATCKSATDATARHRVAIPFLGESWVISEMTAPTSSLNNTNGVVAGGTIKLAKEADYRIISIGDEIDAGTFKVRLADISVAVGADNTHPAILDVLDSNDQVVGQIQVTPGDTYTYTQSSTGSSIKVHVYQTAGGLTLSAKWAEIAIYTDEIKLEDGKRYNDASSDDANWQNVYASLLWKTRDGSATNGQPNSLREIVLYVDDISNYMGGDSRMKAGDSIVFPKANSVYRLTYNGLDLKSTDYSSLRVSSESGAALSVDPTSSNTGCGSSGTVTYQGSFIKITSDVTGGFGGTSSDAMNSYRADSFYVDPIGAYSNGTGGSTSSTTYGYTLSDGSTSWTIYNTSLNSTYTENYGYYSDAIGLGDSVSNGTSTVYGNVVASFNFTGKTIAGLGFTNHLTGTNGFFFYNGTSTAPTSWLLVPSNWTQSTSLGTVNSMQGSYGYLLAQVVSTNTTSASGTTFSQNITYGTWSPVIFYKPAGCSSYKMVTMGSGTTAGANPTPKNTGLGATATTPFAVDTTTVKYDTVGPSTSNAPGLLKFFFNNSPMNMTANSAYNAQADASSTNKVIGEIVMQEDAGKHNTQSDQRVMLRIPVYNLTSNNWNFKSSDSATAYTYYNAMNLTDTSGASVNIAAPYELPLYTERGTKVTGVSTTDVTIMAAKTIAQPMFTFTAASTTASQANTESWVAQEGDTKTLSNGVVLKVVSINQTVGSCTASVKAGGAPACTVTGTNGVSATADPAAALSRYTGSLNMVISDSDPDAKTAGAVRISVGGPLVNSLTSDAMKSSELDATYFDQQNTLIRAFGKTIVVAGKSGSDTMAAADAFIAQLSAQ